MKISSHESGQTIYRKFHCAFNQSTTADFIEERDTSFIIADEVTLLQNSNIGNSIQFKNVNLNIQKIHLELMQGISD